MKYMIKRMLSRIPITFAHLRKGARKAPRATRTAEGRRRCSVAAHEAKFRPAIPRFDALFAEIAHLNMARPMDKQCEPYPRGSELLGSIPSALQTNAFRPCTLTVTFVSSLLCASRTVLFAGAVLLIYYVSNAGHWPLAAARVS